MINFFAAPIRPKNFTLRITSTNSNTTTLHINWNKPPLLPDYYILKVSIFNKHNNYSTSVSANVSGVSVTSMIFSINLNETFSGKGFLDF